MNLRLNKINIAASLNNSCFYYYFLVKPKIKKKKSNLFQLPIKPKVKKKEPYILQLLAKQVTQNNLFLLFIIYLFFSISILNIS